MHIDTVAKPKLRFRTVRFWTAPENRTRPTWRARRCARVQSQYCRAVTRRRAANRRARKARRVGRA